MELKKYQKRVVTDLGDYVRHLSEQDSLSKAFESYWAERQIQVGVPGMKAYQNIVDQVPTVCYKVPTGGGKTFLACASMKTIFGAMPSVKTKAVVWLVPSEAILSQTLSALKNPSHPYRKKLNTDFGARVEVYSKDELLAGQNFSPANVADQVSVMVLSYDSFRVSNKDGRKAYQANGALQGFQTMLGEPSAPIANADETALFQVINQLNPVVVVDESHHARTVLSIEMLQNFNPAFILDLTATPGPEANVISYVDALELKAEHMVKLPVVVYNRASQEDVIADAIDLRRSLEQAAIREEEAGGAYLRPIVLFQAQPKRDEDATSFDKLKSRLIDAGISADHIAIKTSSINELRNIDLASPDCDIRYVITVNALKEGWDCPSAYILASLANRTSKTEVEQVLGRVLRQPNARRHAEGLLNMSFVMTSSIDFQATVDQVVVGLNRAGFTARDYRVVDQGEYAAHGIAEVDEASELDLAALDAEVASGKSAEPLESEPADLSEFDPLLVAEELKSREQGSDAPSEKVESLISIAVEKARDYDSKVEEAEVASDDGRVPADLGDVVEQYAMSPVFEEDASSLRLPQFVVRVPESVFAADAEFGSVYLERESLTENFSLEGRDYSIDLEHASEEMVAVDVRGSNRDQPKAFHMNSVQQQEIRKWLDSLTPEARVDQCAEIVMARLDSYDSISSQALRKYVKRVVENLDGQQLVVLESSPLAVALKIRRKIDQFLNSYRAEVFDRWIDSGRIETKPLYKLPLAISPIDATATVGGSLYEAEGAMNKDERDLIMQIAGLDSVEWWHRVIERAAGSFRLNGAITHYPDFIVKMRSGKVVLVEFKGEMLKNDDSRLKIELGKKWQAAAGGNYRYYMTFKDGVSPLSGALSVPDLLGRLEQL
ncbi:DEAD/DEAH box helicase [Curtobacterium aurantiacum]|uniref:DEAD/DEAH box helicase n=1 Tax=Curtobacterium aurantiacum TaxID=3236919 RepID=UPI001BDFFE4C|nr:DEAD/DEAH box helicase family protein [Curtobacterium flaccumfaciens]MBT1675967.1 DEAD/DEAH box helicase family protein [Curtobacterium flaccumfaciens pv. flaccumfaciens]